MKRPHHMTMKELTALPIVSKPASIISAAASTLSSDIYGGAFEDDRGLAWGTVLRPDGWGRYPLRRPKSVAGAHVLRSFLLPRRALVQPVG